MKSTCCVTKYRKVNIGCDNCFQCYIYTKYQCLVFLNKNFLFLCLIEDIDVMFYEIDVETGKKTWEAGGVFAPTDVHRQVLFSDLISEHNLMAE